MKLIKNILNQVLSSQSVINIIDLQKVFDYFTKNQATFTGNVTFEGGVDVTGATLTGLPPAYATEIEAIDAGLVFGDKYVDSDGVIQTVTKIKQTITLAAGVQTMFGFLIDLDSLASKALLDVLPTYTGALTTFYNGSTLAYSTGIGGNLTEFTNGRGYIAVPSVAFSYSVYGSPLSSSYHQDLTGGNNIVVHNAETTTSASARSWIGVSYSAVITLVGGVQTLNPTTWTKGQAYLITGVGSIQAAIGSSSTPVPVDRSNGELGQVLVPNSDGDAVWGTPSWTTATRPTPLTGQYPMGFNTTTSTHEGWDGSAWNNLY